jgi:hypothetical protein
MMTEGRIIPGGWKISPSDDLPHELKEFFAKPNLGAKIEPLTLLATQLVNGVNYLVLCRIQLVTHSEVITLSKIVVHVPFGGEGSIIEQEAIVNLNMRGGFMLDFSFGMMPQKVATSFDELLSPLHGATYEPVAYVANQVVKGLNHMVLAKQILVVQQPVEHLVLVVINESAPGDLDSKFTVVSIERLV